MFPAFSLSGVGNHISVCKNTILSIYMLLIQTHRFLILFDSFSSHEVINSLALEHTVAGVTLLQGARRQGLAGCPIFTNKENEICLCVCPVISSAMR